MLMEHHETTKHFLDALSLVTVLGTLMSILPSIAALASLVWSVIRIFETKTVQGWLGRSVDDADSK